VTVGVAHADATDVARFPVNQVEPAEDETVVGGVECRDALRSLVDHRITLDESAFMADRSPRVPFGHERTSRPRRLVEARVHAVYVGLLVCNLILGLLLRCGRSHCFVLIHRTPSTGGTNKSMSLHAMTEPCLGWKPHPPPPPRGPDVCARHAGVSPPDRRAHGAVRATSCG